MEVSAEGGVHRGRRVASRRSMPSSSSTRSDASMVRCVVPSGKLARKVKPPTLQALGIQHKSVVIPEQDARASAARGEEDEEVPAERIERERRGHHAREGVDAHAPVDDVGAEVDAHRGRQGDHRAPSRAAEESPERVGREVLGDAQGKTPPRSRTSSKRESREGDGRSGEGGADGSWGSGWIAGASSARRRLGPQAGRGGALELLLPHQLRR